jgi:hypothetical protein
LDVLLHGAGGFFDLVADEGLEFFLILLKCSG